MWGNFDDAGAATSDNDNGDGGDDWADFAEAEPEEQQIPATTAPTVEVKEEKKEVDGYGFTKQDLLKDSSDEEEADFGDFTE